MELTSVVFALGSQPDFAVLRSRGWVHPEGLQGESLTNSLVKTFGDYQIQVVHHQATPYGFGYTEAFAHPVPARLIMRKGEGKGMDLATVTGLLVKLYEELE